jgi:hypothetical protein
MIRLSLLSVILFISYLEASTQEVIFLTNPSLEGQAQHSSVPAGWDNCGYEEESPPDVHPSGTFGVNMAAAKGETYVGMVARDNDTWECIGQLLISSFVPDTCYRIALKMGRSREYTSISRLTQKSVNYKEPCVLRLWGGYKYQDGFEMLAESEAVDHYEWKEYTLDFTPSKDYDYLYLEVYYSNSGLKPYCGHVLIDDLSPIVPCSLIKEGKTVRDF